MPRLSFKRSGIKILKCLEGKQEPFEEGITGVPAAISSNFQGDPDKEKIDDDGFFLTVTSRNQKACVGIMTPYCSEMHPIELEWLHLKRDHLAGQMFDSEDYLMWGIEDALLSR